LLNVVIEESRCVRLSCMRGLDIGEAGENLVGRNLQ
jgi:hypothetical protein